MCGSGWMERRQEGRGKSQEEEDAVWGRGKLVGGRRCEGVTDGEEGRTKKGFQQLEKGGGERMRADETCNSEEMHSKVRCGWGSVLLIGAVATTNLKG